ncbi:MAG: restriction endonuclease subunit S [Desulfurivibrionaceae bacterium]|nr:restriction endonuclease subunit S [Desulfurivibrionaceae bacterium]
MSDWPVVTLKDAGVSLIDCDHKTPKSQENGLPYVGIPQIKEGRIILDGARLITAEDFHQWRRKAKPTPNDVILSRRCNPGETAYVPEGLEIALGQNLVLLRSDGKKLYPPFLRWVVQGLDWWNQIGKFINVGAVFDSLKCVDIPNFEIKLPPMESQKNIADILSALDKKIELNRQINQTLEHIAQIIFKSWFVNFEPVKAKIEAKQNGQDPERAAMCAISGKSESDLDQLPPDQLAQLAATAALFPDELADSEKGVTPENWKWSTIGKEVDVVGGGTPSTKAKDFWEDGIYNWTTPKDLSGVQEKILLDTERKITKAGLEKISSGLLPVNTVLLSSRAPVGYLALAKRPVAINQGYIAMKCADMLPPEYVLQWAESVMDEIKQRASGTTFAEISKKNFRDIPVLVPTPALLREFQKFASAIYEKIKGSLEESKYLTEIRESLLPKLLSGEIELTGGGYE